MPGLRFPRSHAALTSDYCFITGVLRIARSIAAGVGFWHLLPGVACAAEAAPAGFLQFVLDGVLSMGPWAPVVFILTVTIAESIPLLPTQPLSLASGAISVTHTRSTSG